MANRVRVASVADVAPMQAIVVQAGGRRLALCRVNDEFYAIDDACTHDNGPLGEGELDDHQIECPRHGARFDVRTGAALSLPAVRGVKSYPVTVTGDDIFVDVP
ncbi:MAG: non-heme iron oxygenase ferredoxin subunit [Armatimonadetes bacterium]|nr:non-heme iron oxygenase ferredoxin subunit [Armatimonadota bacterium]